MDDSVQFLLRLVNEKYHALITILDQLVVVLVSEDLGKKKQYAKSVLQKSNDLKSVISAKDSPDWLKTLINALSQFDAGKMNQSQLMSHLIDQIPLAKTHKWIFDNPDETAFDFDAIFEKYKAESRLPELFDSIIKTLEEIKNSGEIDSVVMLKALSKVIATLKQNKNGSYLSLRSSCDFLISFFNNYMWLELSKLPVLGTALEALKKTIDETNEEMSKLHHDIKKDISSKVQEEIKALENKTPFPSLEYDKSGGVICDSDRNKQIDEKA